MNLPTTQNQTQLTFNNEQIDVIKNQIAKDATDIELKSFMWQCQRTGLDPFAKQIYFIKSGGKVQIQTSVDGLRLIAERSGMYEGQTPAQWCGADGVWKEIWLSHDFPVAARVGIYKKGFREPLYAVAHWAEYYGQPGYMQKKMPALMISKVAESLALRKAFPNEMEGIYSQEEMGNEPKVVKSINIKNTVESESVAIETNSNPVSKQSDFETFASPVVNHAPEVVDDTILINMANDYRVPFGKKWKDASFAEMGKDNVASFSMYLQNEADKKQKPLDGQALEYVTLADTWLRNNR